MDPAQAGKKAEGTDLERVSIKINRLRGMKKMLKKLSVTAVILAMSAMLLVPTAYAVQSVDAPAQVAL